MKNTTVKIALRLGLASILFAATTQNVVRAEVNGPYTIGFNFGWPVLAGETSEVLKNGFGFGFDFAYRPETSLLGIRFDMVYNSFEITDAVLNRIRTADTGWASAMGFDLSVLLTPPNAETVRPYLQFGPGIYYQRAEASRFAGGGGYYCDPWFGCYNMSNEETVADFNTWRLGWVGGAGLNIEFAGGGAFFLQAQYHMVNNTHATMEFVPISMGFRQSF